MIYLMIRTPTNRPAGPAGAPTQPNLSNPSDMESVWLGPVGGPGLVHKKPVARRHDLPRHLPTQCPLALPFRPEIPILFLGWDQLGERTGTNRLLPCQPLMAPSRVNLKT